MTTWFRYFNYKVTAKWLQIPKNSSPRATEECYYMLIINHSKQVFYGIKKRDVQQNLQCEF